MSNSSKFYTQFDETTTNFEFSKVAKGLYLNRLFGKKEEPEDEIEGMLGAVVGFSFMEVNAKKIKEAETLTDYIKWASDLYWQHSEMEWIEKQITHSITHEIIENNITYPIPKVKNIKCKACEIKHSVLCKNWSHYFQCKLKLVCFVKEIDLASMPYRDYLLTEHWLELKKKVLVRDKRKCQLCNRTKELNVHHNTYERRGEELLSDLIALCKSCHQKHHDILPNKD